MTIPIRRGPAVKGGRLCKKEFRKVSSKENDVNAINKLARVAGLLYLLLIPLSTFGMLYVRYNLLVPGDAAATASNILASESLFRLSIVSALLT
jgi:hypothetical protein